MRTASKHLIQSLKQSAIDLAILANNFREVTAPLARMRKTVTPTSCSSAKRFMILASDPHAPDGSMGELAMLSGLMQEVRRKIPDSTFSVVGANAHQIQVPRIGSVPVLAAWVGREGTEAFHRALMQHDAVLGLGADVLDGKYGAALVCRFASYLNHATLMGKPAAIMGFSFNASPRTPAKFSLARLSKQVKVNVRDQYSLERFKAATGTDGTLCADVAFLMQPADRVHDAVDQWIRDCRSAEFRPVAINLNAHAFSTTLARMSVSGFVALIAEQLTKAARQHALAYLLLPHDTKPHSGDIDLLKALSDQLTANGVERVRYAMLTDPSDIKAAVGRVDLVVTGRMHLAIASLGMGIPTLSITYQDKFEGLYKHFGLGSQYMLTPDACVSSQLMPAITNTMSGLGPYKAQIQAKCTHIRALSQGNLDVLG